MLFIVFPGERFGMFSFADYGLGQFGRFVFLLFFFFFLGGGGGVGGGGGA